VRSLITSVLLTKPSPKDQNLIILTAIQSSYLKLIIRGAENALLVGYMHVSFYCLISLKFILWIKCGLTISRCRSLVQGGLMISVACFITIPLFPIVFLQLAHGLF
jgi:hypothetical protein